MVFTDEVKAKISNEVELAKKAKMRTFEDSPEWLKSRLKELHNEYSGSFELFDKILKVRFQNGWAEAYVSRPQSHRKRHLVIELMEYPDGSWKVMNWRNTSADLETLYAVPAKRSRYDYEDYKADLIK